MLKRVVKFVALSSQDKRLFLAAFCLSGIIRLVILLLPFRFLAPVLGNSMRESSMEEKDTKLGEAKRVGRMVERVSRYTPWESNCLVQAIVGKVLLRKHGISNTLYLGVKMEEERCLVAHAWLRCAETILTGGQVYKKFSVVGKFSDDGCIKNS